MIVIVKDRETARILETSDAGIRRGPIGYLKLFIARRRADVLLRRTLRPYRAGNAAQLSPHLRRDIGLPPDFRM